MAPRGLVIRWKAVGWAVVACMLGSIADFITKAQRIRNERIKRLSLGTIAVINITLYSLLDGLTTLSNGVT